MAGYNNLNQIIEEYYDDGEETDLPGSDCNIYDTVDLTTLQETSRMDFKNSQFSVLHINIIHPCQQETLQPSIHKSTPSHGN